MVTNYWEPKAVPRAQSYSFTIDTFDVNTDYVLQIADPDNMGQKFFISCQTAEEGMLTINGVALRLLESFEEQTHPFKAYVTCELIGTVDNYTGVTITATVPGTPIDVSDVSNPAGSTTLTETVTNKGPTDVGDADNWSLGHVPEAGEDIVFDGYDKGPQHNVNALAAIELATATFKMTHTGLVGTAYAPLKLKLTGKLLIGEGMISETALGSERLNLELVNDNGEAEILNSNLSSVDENKPTIRLIMKGATGKCRVRKAYMKLQVDGTLGTVEVSTISADADTRLSIEGNAFITTFAQYGGNVVLKGSAGTASIFDGVFEHVGEGTITTLVVGFDGLAYLSSGGNLGSISCSGVINFRMNSKPRSIAACTLFKGYELYGNYDIQTFTTGILFDGCKVSDGIFELGQNYKLTPSVPS